LVPAHLFGCGSFYSFIFSPLFTFSSPSTLHKSSGENCASPFAITCLRCHLRCFCPFCGIYPLCPPHDLLSLISSFFGCFFFLNTILCPIFFGCCSPQVVLDQISSLVKVLRPFLDRGFLHCFFSLWLSLHNFSLSPPVKFDLAPTPSFFSAQCPYRELDRVTPSSNALKDLPP